jgi:hypothetical protein
VRSERLDLGAAAGGADVAHHQGADGFEFECSVSVAVHKKKGARRSRAAGAFNSLI